MILTVALLNGPFIACTTGKTVSKIKKEIEATIKISKSTLTLTLLDYQNHATDYIWLPVDGSDAPKIPSGKGKRLIVLHAGNREEGLIDRCDLVFLAKAKDGD
jgi:hypothetical protein